MSTTIRYGDRLKTESNELLIKEIINENFENFLNSFLIKRYDLGIKDIDEILKEKFPEKFI